MTAPLFFVPPEVLAAAGDVVVVDGAEGRHAADVRRLRPGERVDVADGAGALVRGAVVRAGPGRLVVAVDERLDVPAPEPRFVVVQALAKGGRDEDAVAAMTECGVDAVLAWPAARSVARWGDRTLERWRRTAREAAKQARRPRIPDVDGPASTSDLVARVSASTAAFVLHEEAPAPLAVQPIPAGGEVVLVVGPEGGIAPDELEVVTAAGAVACRLGDTVLRTSTAGVAALSVLSAATRWR